MVDSLQNVQAWNYQFHSKTVENTENLKPDNRCLLKLTDRTSFEGDEGTAETESVLLSRLGCLWQPSRYAAELLDFQKGG